MARKKDNDYFEMFIKGASYSCDAAVMLHNCFQNHSLELLAKRIEEMHSIEHQADISKHVLMEFLLKEFITPIEREDIVELASTIDDVTDSIEDVLQRLYMFNVATLPEEAIQFTSIIEECCTALKDMMQEFVNFHKSKIIQEKIIKINHLEEKADILYREAVHNLYLTSQNPIEIIAWTTLFERLEKCCDNCEHVADAVERVILKNS